MYVKTHKDIGLQSRSSKKNKNKRSAVRLGRPANAPPITHSYSITPILPAIYPPASQSPKKTTPPPPHVSRLVGRARKIRL